MEKRFHFGFARLMLLVCLALLIFAPAALAKCKDSDGNEYKKHDWGDWQVTKEATCKKEGKRTRVCNRCGKEESESIDPLGHDWGDWQVTKEATCKEDGKRVRVCSRCDKEDSETIEALGHDWGEWETVKEATCKEEGKRVRVCARCDKEDSETIEALGHDWSDWETVKEATCTEEGKRVRVCARCEKEDSETIEALGHDWSDWETVSEATCEEAGKRVRVCARCEKEDSEEIEALGHDWGDWEIVKEPTCEEEGKRVRVCARCEKEGAEAIEALGHDYESQVTEPTCEAAGYTTYTCKRCGASYTEEGEKALGHDWGEWKIVEPTETESGSKTRVCKRCELTETLILDPIKPAQKPEYTVTFNYRDENYAEQQSVSTYEEDTPSTDIAVPEIPQTIVTAEAEYTFTGWDPEFTAFDALMENKTYTAVYSVEKFYTITVKPGYTGAEDVTIVAKAGEAVKEPELTREHYSFIDWTLPEGVKAFPTKMPSENLTITAQWLPNITKIAALDDVNCYTYKPALEDALKLLPETVEAALADGSSIKATLVWDKNSCPKYGKASTTEKGDGEYEFVPTGYDAEDKQHRSYALDTGVELPSCKLVVGPATSKDKKFEYRMNDKGELIITAWKSKDKTLTLEDTIDGYKVVAIGDEAFKEATRLTQVILPEGLESIGKSAFEGCSKLASLAVPAGVKTIGDTVFADCELLVSLTLPDSLTEIGKDIIKDDELEHLIFSTSLETTLSSKTVFTREPEKGETADEETGMMPAVTLPMAVTDIQVVTSKFTLATDFTVEEGCEINVEAEGSATVASDVTLTNFGTINNWGKFNYHGTILTCGGEWNENEATKKSGGKYVSEHDYDKPDYDKMQLVCKVCGHTEKISTTELTIKYTGSRLSKVYDKTHNVIGTNPTTKVYGWLLDKTLKTSDFDISGKVKGYEGVKIKTIKVAKFDSANAGNYDLKVTFELTGDDAPRYTAKSTTIPASITKRPVVITPTSGLSKLYGQADPTNLGLYCTTPGRLALTEEEKAAGKKDFTGKMSREEGEDVGKYKFLRGTLDFGNDNYDVSMKEEYFTIKPMDISSQYVGLATIGNQRYTGKPITPTITLRYGTRTLKEGVDYTVEFTNNVKAGNGTAKVKITGKGNYTGTKETSFTILNITTDFGSGSSGSGSYSYSGFDSGDFEDMSDDDDFFSDGEGGSSGSSGDVGSLVLDDTDYGTVLYGAQEVPMPFIVFGPDDEDEDDDTAPIQRTVTIIPDAMTDEQTGEEVYLEDGVRERYPELHLRLSAALAQSLMQKGVTDIIYELEQADLRIPLASLVSEIPLDSEGRAVEPTLLNEAAPQMEESEGEFVLDDGTVEAVTSDELTEVEEGVEAPVESLSNQALDTPAMQVESYDIVLEQADATGLTDREKELLDDCDLMMPAYRVRVRVITTDAGKRPTGRVDESGAPIMQPIAKELPEGFYLKDMELLLTPDDNLAIGPEDAQVVYISDAETADEAEESEQTIAEFTDVDGNVVAQLPVNADGLYAVSAPENWDPTPYLAEDTGFDDAEDDEAEDAEEEEYEVEEDEDEEEEEDADEFDEDEDEDFEEFEDDGEFEEIL